MSLNVIPVDPSRLTESDVHGTYIYVTHIHDYNDIQLVYMTHTDIISSPGGISMQLMTH